MATGLEEVISPVRRPKHGFQWEPDHFQRTMGIIPKESVHYAGPSKGGKVKRPTPNHSVTKPPFGLDWERVPISIEDEATGYKTGGPKECRLFRVALLKKDNEVDHLFGVKVFGIPELIQEKELADAFQQFGKVGNVYVPRDGLSRKAVAPFAVVRFDEKESVSRALMEGSIWIKTMYCGPDPFLLRIEENPYQESSFTQNTGVHGMTNAIADVMIRTQEAKDSKRHPVPQNITLDECFSRSGYPWGSKRELKILEAHAPREVMSMHTIKLENLNQYTSSEEIEAKFKGRHLFVGDVYCPRPQHVHLRLNDGRENDGFAFLRFKDARDLKSAMDALNAGLIVFRGDVATGEVWKPYQWPTDKTRRYC